MSHNASEKNGAGPMNRRIFIGGVGLAIGGALLPSREGLAANSIPANGEWHAYSGTNASLKYSPLDQINASNVNQLQIVWRRPMVDPAYTARHMRACTALRLPIPTKPRLSW